MKDFLAQAAKLLKKNKQYRRQMVVFLCLAVVVTFGTVTALKLYGQAMTHQVEVLDCQYKVHEHTEECYDRDENGNLGTEPVCGYALYAIHTHNDACYDAKGNLVCALEEHEKHEHKEECYLTEKVLVCELEETEVTVPPEEDAEASEETPEAPEETPETPEETPEETEAPAGEEPPAEPEAPSGEEAPVAPPEPAVPEGPICGKEPHTHGEGCYEDTIVCGFAEEHAHGEGCATQTLACTVAEHAHGEGCTDEEGNMTCTLEEHAHQEGCYTQEMTCGKEEHTHAEGCHAQNLVCALEEHEHIESCYAQAPAAPAQGSGEASAAEGSGSLEECDETGEGHIHTEECYEEVTTLVCGELELHTHDDSCYSEECFDEEGKLIEGSRVSCELLQLEEHIHVHTEGEDSCFKTVELTPEEVAALENGATLHIHEDGCYDEEGNLICGHDANHVHMPQCYDDAGKLICGYGTAVHVHEAKCYDAEGNLICGYETASHVHEENCYDAEGNLQCGYETATHVHGKECYDEEGNLTCGYEAAAHVHEDSCYDAEGNLICGYGTVSDTEDTVTLDGTFTYEAEDYTLEIHVQTDVPAETQEPDAPVESTTDEETAGTEEKAESGSEAEAPSTEEDNSTTTEAESQPVTDDNGEEPEQEASASGIEELSEVHEGDTDTTAPETEESQEGDVPEDTNPDEAEGQPEQGAQILIADEASGLTLKMSPLDAAEGIYAEMADYVEGIDGSRLLDLSVMELHVYRDGKEIDISDCTVAVNIMPKAVTTEEMIEAYGEEAAAEEGNGIIVSALQKTADGVRGSGNVFLTPDMAEIPVLQNAVAENGVLAIARYVNSETITKTFRGESFIVTATYKPNANIPAEAELLAEQITEESDSDHYAKRQEEYQEALGDETATMRALMKIGFYVEDENGEFTTEVEPESPVTITIQFLDEDGLAEGKPITVIHFVEDGTELLEGSKVQDSSTTFKMESFSEIAVGYGVENVRVPVDESIDYNTDAFHITFHIEGEVTVPVDGKADREDGNQESPEDGDLSGEPSDDNLPAEDGSNEVLSFGDAFSAMIEKEELEGDLEFRLDSLAEGAEEYAAVASYTEELGDEDGELLLQIMSYSLNYGDVELDLTDCVVTAEINPTQALVDSAMEIIDEREALALSALEDEPVPQMPDNSGDEGVLSGDSIGEEIMENPEESEEGEESDSSIGDMGEDGSGETQDQSGLIISAIEILNDGQIGGIETTSIGGVSETVAQNGNDEADESIVIELTDGTFALRAATGQPNPSFTVYYYAKLEVLNEKGAANKLIVIDTSNGGKNEGGKLPINGSKTELPSKSIPIKADGNINTKIALTQVYKSRPYTYYKAPTINYFNALIENGSYTLAEVWVNRKEKVSEDGSKTWWNWTNDAANIEKYQYGSDLHFTNRKEAATATPGGNSGYVYISSDAKIRLVYNVTNDNKNFSASFYDYDISSSTTTKNGVTTMKTEKGGINAATLVGEGIQYAFGNVNCGTSFGGATWQGNSLNKHNPNNTDPDGKKGRNWVGYGCTFGLVTGVSANRSNVVFASGIKAPANLFGPTAYEGKSVYDGGLEFIRKGDTYTLTTARVTGASTVSNLQKFNQPSPCNGKVHDTIWTNNFWPMDAASQTRKDINFGVVTGLNANNYPVGNGKQKFDGATSGDLPVSDDGKNHNSFFGMSYQVGFKLTEDYVGPLEYYFFGDDDMWVFLDNQLVCDIGGVHSSVGEYVNLWDYLEKGSSGEHTLSFFYTERGASGSTCWMQFTLPSATTIEPPKKDYGELKVEKTVDNIDTDKEFTFHIQLTDAQGKPLADNYSYAKYQKGVNGAADELVEGTEEDQYGLVLHGGSDFTLKHNQYIIIRYIPVGTKYTIKETGGFYDTDIERDDNGNKVTKDKLVGEAEREIGGQIQDGVQSVVKYRNYAYALPETGGSGTILYTMAGGMAFLFGAGFLYKKKFRERRG